MVVCGEHFEIGEMEADHIIPWSRREDERSQLPDAVP